MLQNTSSQLNNLDALALDIQRKRQKSVDAAREMTPLKTAKYAITQMSSEELAEFYQWFTDYEGKLHDA